METKQVTVQPAVGGMIKASKDSFVIPKEELKDFYLKFAFLLNPDSCSINRTEFELLNILLKDLKKSWQHWLTSTPILGMKALQKSKFHAVLTPYKITWAKKNVYIWTPLRVNTYNFLLKWPWAAQCSNCYSRTITTIISKWKVWLNRWLKKSTNSNDQNRSWRISRGGTFRKTYYFSKYPLQNRGTFRKNI